MSNVVNNKIFLAPFFAELNSQQIQYCVLRNYELLPDSLGGSDLDILVQDKDINNFYRVLYKVLQSTEGEIIIRYGRLSPRICIIGSNAKFWYALQIDVHESILPYKSSSMFPVDFLLSRVHLHNNIYVADNDDLGLIAFLKEVLHNKQIEQKYFEPAKTAWSNHKGVYKEILSTIYSANFLDDLSGILQSNYNPRTITNLAVQGRKQLTKKFTARVLNLKLNLLKVYRFFWPPGYMIAFVGSNCIRKLSVINKVSEVLNEASHNELHHDQFQPCFVSNIARYWLKIYPKKVKKSCVWIFDASSYNCLIGLKGASIRLPLWMIKLVQAFVPKPDLVIYLESSQEVICNRGSEAVFKNTEGEFDKLKKFYGSRSNIVWVSLDQPEEETMAECLKIISKNMSSRYKKHS